MMITKATKPKSKTAKKAAKPKDVKSEVKADPKPEPDPTPADDKAPVVEAKPDPPKRKSLVCGPDGGFGVPSDEPILKKGEPRCRVKNMRNKRVDITLEHDVYCNGLGRCVCSSRVVIRERRIERKSKAMAPRRETIRIPKSFILPPMGESEPLHAAVKECADVKSKLLNRPQKLMIVPA